MSVGNPLRVLVTGAAGRVGRDLAPGLVALGFGVTGLDLARQPPDCRIGWITRDLNDVEGLEALLHRQDAVVHLAGHPTADDWPTIEARNLRPTHALIEAAGAAGVGRLVYASSIHAAGYARCGARFDSPFPIRPDSLYGASKVFGEAAARYASERYGMTVVNMRLGTVRDRPETKRESVTWISPRDLAALVAAALACDDGRVHEIWGFSANTAADVDRSAWDRIGYSPVDDAVQFGVLPDRDLGTPGEDRIGGRFVRHPGQAL